MAPTPPPLDLLARAVPASFEICMMIIDPGCAQPYEEPDWRDALIEIDHGQIEIELRGGTRHRLITGDLFWLRDLPVRMVHNVGPDPAVLVSLTRTSHRRR